MSPHRGRSAVAFAGFALAVLAAASLGGVAASSARGAYDSLDLPPFAPPGWVFSPVWTLLYILIAISGWLVWREVGMDRSIAVFVGQLGLIALWPPIFFVAGSSWLALVEIVVLLATTVATIVLFSSRSLAATWLMVPCTAWVGYSTALNAGIVLAN